MNGSAHRHGSPIFELVAHRLVAVEQSSSVADAIEALLGEPQMSKLVAKYFDPREPFAGYLFDQVGDNPRDGFSEGDLLAITFLDVACSPLAVRALFAQPERWSQLLAPCRATWI